jgi:exopolysaccharide biosynthesis polyprenyl glycosylphosphotransferase
MAGLLVTDALMVLFAVVTANAVLVYRGASYSSPPLWTVPLWLVLFGAFGLYQRESLFSGSSEYTRVINACTVGLVAEVMFGLVDPHLQVSSGWLLLTWLLSTVVVISGRFGARQALRLLRQRGYYQTRTLIVGTNEEARALAGQILDDPGVAPHVVGFVDPLLPPGARVIAGKQLVASLDSLGEALECLKVHEVIVATTAVSREQLLALYRTVAGNEHVELRLSSGLSEILSTGMQVREINHAPLVTPRRVRITGVAALAKNAIDYLVAAAALILLSPLLAAIALLIRLDSPGPIIHRRRVLGLSGRCFDAFKFRTMIGNAERRQQVLPIAFPDRRTGAKAKHDPRITRIGLFLRRASLDELPQLVNVLRGEMSLVGPRMIAPEEASHYGDWQLNLTTVKPGITGPWQVRGRADIPYEERVRLSMQYIRNYSVWLDLEIIVRTIFVVALGRGAY